jgi:RNA polymerase sigma-70 factor (ECF subfamily)
MRDLTLDLEPLDSVAEGDTVMQMDEEVFRSFYDRTARSVWAYLARLTGSTQSADDLLQDTYYRFLRAARAFDSDDHRRNYLFRIATNLARDAHRRNRHRVAEGSVGGVGASPVTGDESEQAARRADLTRAMARLKPRERSLLWLAYAEGSSHLEIADALGLKTSSVKVLLFRARRRLMLLMNGKGRS